MKIYIIILLIIINIKFYLYCISKKDILFILCTIILFLIIILPLVAIYNFQMPFSDQGDDLSYFQTADKPFNSFEEIFDFQKYSELYEQPGYTWLLTIINTLFGHNLLYYKFFNVYVYIIICILWYKIGVFLDGYNYSKKLFIKVLCITPLWYYCFILRKDLIIVLIQSLFIFSAIRLWFKINLTNILLLFVSLFLVLPFRTILVLQNIIILIGGLLTKYLSKGTYGFIRNLFVVAFVSLIIIIPFYLFQDALIQASIFSEDRKISTETVPELNKKFTEVKNIDKNIFIIDYVFTDLSGFNLSTWHVKDYTWLRGFLSIPWVLFSTPFFANGILWLFRKTDNKNTGIIIQNKLSEIRFVSTPWVMILYFIITSFFISYLVGDSTRYRAPDMPMFMAIVLCGWLTTKKWAKYTIYIIYLIVIFMYFVFINYIRDY